jgi:hypothetical protein
MLDRLPSVGFFGRETGTGEDRQDSGAAGELLKNDEISVALIPFPFLAFTDFFVFFFLHR